MKVALTIEEGRSQIVLTPETETERNVVKLLLQEGNRMSVKTGAFYPCRGGWSRWGEGYADESTIIVLEPLPTEPSEGYPEPGVEP